MRDTERAVINRLMKMHPALHDASVFESHSDPPDAIVVSGSGRLGFELTDVFSVGDTNSGGSEFLQFNQRWTALKQEIVNVLQHKHANLDQCDVYLRLSVQSPNSLDLVNLPRPMEYRQFAIQLIRAIFANEVPFNSDADRAIEVSVPRHDDYALLRKFAKRIEIIWRPASFGEVNVAADVHLPAVEGGYLHTGTQKLETAILRKGNPSREQRKRIDAADVRELYLVLGGQQTGLLPHLQGQTRAGLERDLSFVRYRFETSVFHGLVLFDDFGDRLEVFCSLCLLAIQKSQRVGVGPLDFYTPGMFEVPHACPVLARHS
jgi:hypothetical protein